MKKAICSKCKSLIMVDQTVPTLKCPNCGEQILTETAIKYYYDTISAYRRKADIAFKQKADYETAFTSYDLLHQMVNDDLGILILLVLSKLRSSTMHSITIKEATDLLLKGSDTVEITYDNVNVLSDFFIRIREDAKIIVDAFKAQANKSQYALNQYHEALKQYEYYLKAYLDIYHALDKMNQYLKDSTELINDEIKATNSSLKEKITPEKSESTKHEFFDENGKFIDHIFKNKIKSFKLHLALYAVTGVGLILSILGLIFIATMRDNIPATVITLCLGLPMLFGGYFINHYLTYTKPRKEGQKLD